MGLVFWFVFTDRDPFHGVNAGLLALGANLLVTVALTLRRPADTPDERLARPEEHTHEEDRAPAPSG